ncbi:MAG TPA: signal recognition particle-docking protein FtsY [bacterium]|nr:signal recognition particle-docking protein FtsY [bacterium]
MGLFDKIRAGLSKTRVELETRFTALVHGYERIDEDFLEALEETLITADVGVQTALALTDSLRRQPPEEKLTDARAVARLLRDRLRELLPPPAAALQLAGQPAVVLVLGVNGTGKTTTVAKLAAHLKSQGRTVVLAAADTFRAAALEQLVLWSERVGVPCIRQKSGADPSAVIFDALAFAVKRNADTVLVDTAGRLHTVANLVEELKKIRRVIERQHPGQPCEVLLVLDATCGQNALQQARVFHEATQLTGLVLTKLDGTAKGGIGLAIMRELQIPVKFIGVGEQLDDLRPFDRDAFLNSLLGIDDAD